MATHDVTYHPEGACTLITARDRLRNPKRLDVPSAGFSVVSNPETWNLIVVSLVVTIQEAWTGLA